MARMLFAAVFTLLLLGCGGPSDPVYQGRTVSQWLEDFNESEVKRMTDDELVAFTQNFIEFGPDALPVLRNYLHNNDRQLCTAAAMLIVRMDSALVEQELLPVLRNGHSKNRVFISNALILMKSHEQFAFESLAKTLFDTDPWIRNHSIRTFGTVTPESVGAVAPLAKMLRTAEQEELRWRAAYGLVRIGPAAAAAVPDLIAALEDPNEQVREGAAYALGSIGRSSESIRQALQTASQDANAKVRLRAEKALEQIRS